MFYEVMLTYVGQSDVFWMTLSLSARVTLRTAAPIMFATLCIIARARDFQFISLCLVIFFNEPVEC